MNSLAQFPREILAHILLGPHCSFLSIVLWKCGDRLLQEKLSQCITSIDLKDETQVPLSRWPDCLSRFVNLRNLSIVLSNGYLACSPSDLQDSMLSLSPKLEELVIISRDKILASPGNSVICSTSTSFESLLKLDIPILALESLTNKHHPFYQLLTRNIRDLSLFDLPASCYLESSSSQHDWISLNLVESWPPNLEILRNHPVIFNHLLKNLPTSLKTIESIFLDSDIDGFHQYMPTKLELESVEWTLELSLMVPHTVTDLIFLQIGDCGDVHWSQTMPKSLTSLASSLIPFELNGLAFRHLPRTLTKIDGPFTWDGDASSPMIELPNLKIVNAWYDMGDTFASKFPPSVTEYAHAGSISHQLPPNLKHAKFRDLDTIEEPITAPLQTLEVIGSFPFAGFKYLPSTLTTLALEIGIDDEFTLDLPLLTTLKLSYIRISRFKFLPRSLTSLDTFIQDFGSNTELDMSRFGELPRGLKSLWIHSGTATRPRIDSRCFTPCVSLELLSTNLPVDTGICNVVKTHLHKLRYLNVEMADGSNDQYLNGLPSRLVPVPSADPVRKYAMMPQPKNHSKTVTKH